MTPCRIAAFAIMLGVPAAAVAQTREGPAYEADMKASMMLLSFDALAARCDAKGGFAANDAGAINQWKSTNQIDAMRTRARALQADAVSGADLGKAVTFLTGRVMQSGLDPCAAAVKITQSSEAQFATLLPGLAGKGAATAHATQRPGTSKPGGASPLAGQIDSFGFDTKAAMGIGGFITTAVYPVVLFKDGSALTDVTGLNDPVAHRRANPEDWVRWRRSGGKIELMKSSGWKAMSFSRTYASLPAGFRLDGLFRRLTGVGSVAIGGGDSVTAVSEYRFWPDGAVVRGASLGSTASSGDSSVVTSSVNPNARGRYRVDGLTLSIRYDDGSSERRILVADPADPKTAIWLDGKGYVRRGR